MKNDKQPILTNQQSEGEKEPNSLQEKISYMQSDNFTGWSEDAKNGYLTACATITEWDAKQQSATVQPQSASVESVEQASERYIAEQGFTDEMDIDYLTDAIKFGAQYQQSKDLQQVVELIEGRIEILGDINQRVSASEYWYKCALHDVSEFLKTIKTT